MADDNIYTLRPNRRYPSDTRKCLTKLLSNINHPTSPIEGVAFIAFVNGSGFIVDACGKAKAEAGAARLMLPTLDAKLARWEK